MNHQEQLQQSLLELHYGLLDDAESKALRDRIGTDIEVAKLWAATLAMASQFADAASLTDLPVVEESNWVRPSLDPVDSTKPGSVNRTADPSANPFADHLPIAEIVQDQVFPPIKPQPVNGQFHPVKTVQKTVYSPAQIQAQGLRNRRIFRWRWYTLAVAAACCLALIAGQFLTGMPTSPGRVLRIEAQSVAGDELNRNQFEFFTTRLASHAIGATEYVQGVSATLSVAVQVGQVVIHRANIETDQTGRGVFQVPTELKLPQGATLHVGSDAIESELVVPLEPTRCLTYLSIDKPVYRPGETIRFRSLTLERYSLRPDIDLPIRFEMLDPSGAAVQGAQIDGVTERGVGNGEFPIPQSAPGGQYTLVVKSLDGFFPTEQRTVDVRNYRVPRFKKDIEFGRRSYGPGETVTADFEAIRAEGGPLANQQIQVTARVDGKVVFEDSATTGPAGTRAISFQLPELISRGSGQLSIAIDDGGTQEVQSKTIPIQLGKAEVDFYPEGGYLVAGLTNRVYFSARNPLGEPIHVAGEIQTRSGQQVAQLETTRDGMGRFEFTPVAGEKYALRIREPVDVTNHPALPRVVDHLPVMSTGTGVFRNREPIQFSIRTQRQRTVTVQAVCRGQLVANQKLELKPGESSLKIELPPSVEGVVRLTVLDSVTTPAQPLVERLVYRETARQLTVSVNSESSLERTPGQPVRLSLSVVDENGDPAPAVLGVTVVDDAALSLEEIERPELRTHFVLTSEIEKPEDLEHANFYLSGTDESRESLDLLLGTQGWRRFVTVDQTDLDNPGDASVGFSEQISRLIQLDGNSNKTVAVSSIEANNELWNRYTTAASNNWSKLMTNVRWFVSVLLILMVMVYLTRPKLKLSSQLGLWLAVACGAALLIGCSASESPRDRAVRADVAESDVHSDAEREANSPNDRDLSPLVGLNGFKLPGELLVPPDWFKDNPAKAASDEQRIQIVDHQPADPASGMGAGAGIGVSNGDGKSSNRNINDSALAQLLQSRGLTPDQLGIQLMEELRFPIREYAHQHKSNSGIRSDFTETLYWQPLLITDSQGKATIRFDLSDSVTTFRVHADAHANDGRIGSGVGEVVARLPLQVEPKMPLAVTHGDRIDLPVAVINATHEPLPVALEIKTNDALQLDGSADRSLSLSPQQRTREYFELNVASTESGEAIVELRGQTGTDSLSDVVRKKIHVSPSGYPVRESVSGVLDQKVSVLLPIPATAVPGSVAVSIKAYPSPLADLLAGVDSILREPHGCFEQTSATNYPNTMALQYLRENQLADPQTTRRAKSLLERGYSKLVSFECQKQGYEWFGSDPGHEALSAFGLLQFTDMSQVMNVDQEMVRRTRNWLMDRRDGAGGFQRNPRHLHVWSVDQKIVDAYVLWALTESDVASGNPQRAATELATELNQLLKVAKNSNDPYYLSLAAACMLNIQRSDEGEQLLDKLVELQQSSGELNGQTTVTQSGGISRQVETTSLALLAWAKRGDKYSRPIRSAAQWLVKNRQGDGGFGSTQATVLALKALVAYSKVSSSSSTGSVLYVKHNDQVIGQMTLPAEPQTGTILEITGLGNKLPGDATELVLEAAGTKHLPFSVEVLYHTLSPPSDTRCPLKLTTEFITDGEFDGSTDSGATLQVRAVMTNSTDEGQPMTIAVIGLPGGVEPRVARLNELRDEGLFDFYELREREVICYWRTIAPGEQKEIVFDVTAEIPGKYTAPASKAYLYYTAEQKTWAKPLAIEIRR